MRALTTRRNGSTISFPGEQRAGGSRQAIFDAARDMLERIPDRQPRPKELIAAGDCVAASVDDQGTVAVSGRGWPATGDRLTLPMLFGWRFEDGLITSEYAYR